jgi:Coenzyme PQQ synthesis protein D (PqqD)
LTDYRSAPDVAVVEEDDVVYTAILPDGPIVVLDGVAGVIWMEACDGPSSTIADRVAAVTGSAADEIRDEVESFVEQLVTRGLLTRREP